MQGTYLVGGVCSRLPIFCPCYSLKALSSLALNSLVTPSELRETAEITDDRRCFTDVDVLAASQSPP